MDQIKTGKIIKKLRLDAGLTQVKLAEKLSVTDKAVSRWERGIGLPDHGLLKELSDILKIDMSSLLQGELKENPIFNGKMTNIRFFVCPRCGNIITSTGDSRVICCSEILSPLTPFPETDGHSITVENIENEYYFTSSHPMVKEHYISFAAFVTKDSVSVKKTYPEWKFEAYFPRRDSGVLYYYCARHGLFYKKI